MPPINHPKSVSLITLAVAATFAGCTVGPNYRSPEMATPGSWSATTRPLGEHASATAPTTLPAETVDLARWWASLGDEQLNTLIERAVRQNLDLKVAVERVNQARALRGVARADLFPTVNADGHYQREHFSKNTPLGASLPKSGYDDYQAGFDASWELDAFGRVRRSVEAADADLASVTEVQNDVLVRLVAETARLYVELRSAQRRLAVATDNLDAQRGTYKLVQLRRDGGAVSDLDVSRSEADVKSAEAALPQIQSEINEAIYALGVLLGQEPNALYAELEKSNPIPSSAQPPALGIPSELLRRRPDIRSAERKFAAATARIGVAVADYYPRFTLTGSFAMDASQFRKTGDWDSRQFAFGPSFSWNIFDAGRIKNNVHFTEARQREALILYQQTVLQSLQEVETALSRYTTERERHASVADAVLANERSVSLAKQQYAAGAIDLLQVLDAQRNLFASQESLARSDGAITTQLIAIYKGLGGGWDFGDQRTANAASTKTASTAQ